MPPDCAVIAAIVSSHTQPPWPPPCRNTKSVIGAIAQIPRDPGIGQQGIDLARHVEALVLDELQFGRMLEPQGIRFETDNDSEVAAGYLSWKLREGATLAEALEASLDDLDGFFTFVVGTENGFAVLRDPISCKPAVMAETDQYVAFGSEYRALVGLPGIESARVFEPEPARVYAWERN